MNRKLTINPQYNPDSVILERSFGVKDLKRYKEKIKKNVRIFQDAIAKEKAEMKRIDGMISSLQSDIKQAKQFKRLKKK